jgi:hypothetical protein
LLLSDGANTTGDATPLEAADQAAKGEGAGVHGRARHRGRHDHDHGPGRHRRASTASRPTRPRWRPSPSDRRQVLPPPPTPKSLQSVYSRIGSQVGTKVEQRELTAASPGRRGAAAPASALSLAWFNRLP